jgi:hypothetical protein
MVLHAWVEPRSRLRVRASWTVDVDSGSSATRYAGNAPDALRIVQEWLDEVWSRSDRSRS